MSRIITSMGRIDAAGIHLITDDSHPLRWESWLRLYTEPTAIDGSGETHMCPTQARMLAALLVAAADECERRNARKVGS